MGPIAKRLVRLIVKVDNEVFEIPLTSYKAAKAICEMVNTLTSCKAGYFKEEVFNYTKEE